MLLVLVVSQMNEVYSLSLRSIFISYLHEYLGVLGDRLHLGFLTKTTHIFLSTATRARRPPYLCLLI